MKFGGGGVLCNPWRGEIDIPKAFVPDGFGEIRRYLRRLEADWRVGNFADPTAQYLHRYLQWL